MTDRRLTDLERKYAQRRRQTVTRLLKAEIAPELKRARLDGRVLAAALELWTDTAPEIVPHIRALSFRAGTLTVRMSDGGAAFVFDRRLRAGLERETARTVKASLRRIKVRS